MTGQAVVEGLMQCSLLESTATGVESVSSHESCPEPPAEICLQELVELLEDDFE